MLCSIKISEKGSEVRKYDKSTVSLQDSLDQLKFLLAHVLRRHLMLTPEF